METELEQEGTENAWRTADIRIRKTQVLSLSVVGFGVLAVVSCVVCHRRLPLLSFQKRNSIRISRSQRRVNPKHNCESKSHR